MKKLVLLFMLIGVFTLCLLYKETIVTYIFQNFTNYQKEVTPLENNQYASFKEYQYVSLTNDFIPYSRQDILNIYYTVLNSGMKEFTFYCPYEYKNCIDDVKYISNNKLLLSNINNFVPVYNSFAETKTNFNTLGKVNIQVTHNYTKNQIDEIENEINFIIKENITYRMTTEEKIKTIHDYIIDHTKYDKDRSDNKIFKYQSDTAYGAIIEHYAICGGYADSMKLFLDKLDIPNYKISSENHIWNLVYVDGNWLHLDLTWDDPVAENKDILEYDYFLITTEELKKLDNEQHIFDENVYKEAKNS